MTLQHTVTQAQGYEIDFGRRLELNEITKMLPGSSMGLPGATLTRLEEFAGNDRTSGTIAVKGTPTETLIAGLLTWVFFFLRCVSRICFF